MVLSHVIALPHSMDHFLVVFDECVLDTFHGQRANHRQRIERETLEILLASLGIGSLPTTLFPGFFADLFLVLAFASSRLEGITQAHRIVSHRLRRANRRNRLDRIRLAGAYLSRPVFQITGSPLTP